MSALIEMMGPKCKRLYALDCAERAIREFAAVSEIEPEAWEILKRGRLGRRVMYSLEYHQAPYLMAVKSAVHPDVHLAVYQARSWLRHMPGGTERMRAWPMARAQWIIQQARYMGETLPERIQVQQYVIPDAVAVPLPWEDAFFICLWKRLLRDLNSSRFVLRGSLRLLARAALIAWAKRLAEHVRGAPLPDPIDVPVTAGFLVRLALIDGEVQMMVRGRDEEI